MIGLTKSLARKWQAAISHVNAVASGWSKPNGSEMNAEYREKILSQIPLGRLGNVQEAAEIVAFLLSGSARYITGQVIQADGGLAM